MIRSNYDLILIERVKGKDFLLLGKCDDIEFLASKVYFVLEPLNDQILPVFYVIVPVPNGG
jgi:hypothetical protein